MIGEWRLAIGIAWILANSPIPQSLNQSPIVDRQSSIIRGVVTDDKTSAPIAGARVVLLEAAPTDDGRGRPGGSRAPRNVNTNAEGRFEFSAVAPGHYTIAVSIIGYIYVRRRIDVSANATVDLAIPLAEGTGTYRDTVSVMAGSTSPAALGVSSQSDLGSAALQDLRCVIADDPMRA